MMAQIKYIPDLYCIVRYEIRIHGLTRAFQQSDAFIMRDTSYSSQHLPDGFECVHYRVQIYISSRICGDILHNKF
jgi:hypothetical protein